MNTDAAMVRELVVRGVVEGKAIVAEHYRVPKGYVGAVGPRKGEVPAIRSTPGTEGPDVG